MLKIRELVSRPAFMRAVMILILLNAILVGIESYPHLYETYYSAIHVMDRLLLWAFTIEIVLRVAAARKVVGFFKDGWNVFDFVVVLSGHLFTGGSFITVLRVLRVLRLLRSISIIPSLRRIVNALLLTLPSLGNIALLLSILLYVFAVAGTMMFGNVMPEYFGALHLSLLTLFQIITLDSWSSGLMRPLLEIYPWAWVYFVSFVLFGTFIVMNLIVGVIVTNLDRANASDAEEQPEQKAEAASPASDAAVQTQKAGDGGTDAIAANAQIASLRNDIAELKDMVRRLSERQS